MPKDLGEYTLKVIVDQSKLGADSFLELFKKIANYNNPMENRIIVKNKDENEKETLNLDDLLKDYEKDINRIKSQLKKRFINMSVMKNKNTSDYVVLLRSSSKENLHSGLISYIKETELYEEYKKSCKSHIHNKDYKEKSFKDYEKKYGNKNNLEKNSIPDYLNKEERF